MHTLEEKIAVLEDAVVASRNEFWPRGNPVLKAIINDLRAMLPQTVTEAVQNLESRVAALQKSPPERRDGRAIALGRQVMHHWPVIRRALIALGDSDASRQDRPERAGATSAEGAQAEPGSSAGILHQRVGREN